MSRGRRQEVHPLRLKTVLCLIGAVLCLGYFACMVPLAMQTTFYWIWLFLGLCLLVLAWAVQKRLWRRMAKGLRAVLDLFLILCLAVLAVTQACVLSGFHEHGEPDLDCVIVLGALVTEDGPSRVLQYRLDTAAAYLLENPDTICVVSGGQGSAEPATEASVMKEYLVGCGIDEDRILTEEASSTTVENIRNSRDVLGRTDLSVGIVTNNFHVFRGTALARAAGFEDVCGIAAPASALYLPNNMLRESFGLVKDFVCGNL